MDALFQVGAPCWAGFRSPDLAGSIAFYSALFGWEPTVMPNGYVIFSQRGKAVAGGGPLSEYTQQPGWCTYIGVEDADRTAQNAAVTGGTVLVEPFDVPGYGRVGILSDPVGAEFWIWQPLGFTGAQLNAEPGAICRQELKARNVNAAKAFYSTLFGDAAAALCRPPEPGDQAAAEWLVSFTVEDAAAVEMTAQTMGGSIIDSGASRTLLADPHGCRFEIV